MSMTNSLNIFGVRHLSPAASFHLIEYLNEKKPKHILLEAPADLQLLVSNLSDKRIKPPIAMLAYTTELPIETLLYPFASYSPEYQAMVWASKNKAAIEFIDLPACISLKLQQERKQETGNDKNTDFYNFQNNLYNKIAESAFEADYVSYWERNFEHNLNKDSFQKGITFLSTELRDLIVREEHENLPFDFAYNLIRESFMKRKILEMKNNSVNQDDFVIIVGAYHIAGITNDLPAMNDKELAKLPKVETLMTLMPYSYHRLSSRTGYGAGNKAPYYFELMWQCMQAQEIKNLGAIYLSKIAIELRKLGYNASSASVIEAVRLAKSLTALRDGNLPVLKDLHDAVITCFGHGDLSIVAESINRIDIGTAIGHLPEGVSQTPVQEDMNQELKRLKLTNYKSAIAQDIHLDLRENLKVKSVEAAFIDLNRSSFFHRLNLLKISFVQFQQSSQASSTWSEKWILQWSPEVEIQVVEANLKGETLKVAAAFELKELLENCTSVKQSAELIKMACECNLLENFTNAISVLQQLLIDSNDFVELSSATRSLSLLLQYGDIRSFDLTPLMPILQQLFLRASLLLVDAASCDYKAAKEIADAVNVIDLVSEEQHELVDSAIWQAELEKLAWRDDRNARLSGTAFSILLAHNRVVDVDCANEVSRRLSPGVPADIGAAWFEGLSSRNHYSLLSRVSIWKELDAYIQGLNEDEFSKSVVFLRRAFGCFDPNHKSSIATLLRDIWGEKDGFTEEILLSELTESETENLNDLNDFDFDF